MLAKLESFYLNMLRVVILVLATVLLCAAVMGAVVAGPMLLSSFGGGKADAARLVRDDRLTDYLNQGQTTASNEDGQVTEAQQEAARRADRRIQQAADNIVRYVRAQQGFSPVAAAVTGYIQERADMLPERLYDRYADSILQLSKDLTAQRRGAAAVDVDQLIDWHFQKFAAAAEAAAQRDMARAAEEAQRRATAIAAGAGAVSFFMMFLLLVFVFVLVKIERNLRLLPVWLSDKGPEVAEQPSSRRRLAAPKTPSESAPTES